MFHRSAAADHTGHMGRDGPCRPRPAPWPNRIVGAARLTGAFYVLQLCGIHVLLKARDLAVAYLPYVADLRVESFPGLLVGSRVAPLNHDNITCIVELSGVDGEAVPFRREPHEEVLHDSVRSQPGLAAGLVRISFRLAPLDSRVHPAKDHRHIAPA